jgi:hypothetical protein
VLLPRLGDPCPFMCSSTPRTRPFRTCPADIGLCAHCFLLRSGSTINDDANLGRGSQKLLPYTGQLVVEHDRLAGTLPVAYGVRREHWTSDRGVISQG